MRNLSCLLLIALTGCSTINPAIVQKDVHGYKSAYVVTHGGNSGDMDSHLLYVLAKRGVKVRGGPESSKPTNVDMYVTYTDDWSWDLVMYLHELDIQFYDAKSGDMLAEGSFHNSFAHTYPNPEEKVDKIIATMYGEK